MIYNAEEEDVLENTDDLCRFYAELFVHFGAWCILEIHEGSNISPTPSNII